MVTKCANPSCGALFHSLRNGKLFLVDLPRCSSGPGGERGGRLAGRTAEYFWLCDQCSAELTVVVDGSGQPAVAKARASGRV